MPAKQRSAVKFREVRPVFQPSTRKEKAMKVLIEVRPGEGGEDAKLLVREQSRMYLRYAEKNGLRADIEERGGL
ncbi:MAG: PCRF domain-containing protein [Anaerolineae bacterium]|nr:PCRF domain-containing protein [Anaerolineae bacterium]